MRKDAGQTLLALALVGILMLNMRPLVRLAAVQPEDGMAQPAAPSSPIVAVPIVAVPATPVPVAVEEIAIENAAAAPAGTATEVPVDLPLQPCRAAAWRAACDADAAELADYGLDVAAVADWTLFGLQRCVEAVERLADALGGGGLRVQRIAHFMAALHTGPDGTRVRVLWQATPQQRDGNPVRGGYAANSLFFNPNTLFLDRDTADEVIGRSSALFWWNFVHELAHLWDERSATVPAARYSARMQRWLDGQRSAGRTDERPSSYAITGGILEAFAESVAATVTGDAAVREYYGSPRDDFVRTILCEASDCLR